MSEYTPEVGQAVFGAPWDDFDLEEQCPQASHFLRAICELLPTPDGCMSGAADWQDEFFEVHPYWWGDEEAPEASRPNFRRGGVCVRWYKHCGRGLSTNVQMSNEEWLALFAECISHAVEVAREAT